MITAETSLKHINSPRQVLFASLVGTTIEFFDFYIYATAAVLVFPRLFFPAALFSSLEIRPSFNLTSLVGGEITARNSFTRIEHRILPSYHCSKTAK
jgi:hypothetical protein